MAKDSKFQLLRPVTYSEKRPPLYEDTLQFIADSLFGDQEARRKAIIENIIYTKTLRWKYEGEYRLCIPLRKDEEPWETLAYHGEEITELYLGSAMQTGDREEIVRLAKAVNPNVIIFRATLEMDEKIRFERI